MWKQPDSRNLQRRSLQNRLSLLPRESIVNNESLLDDDSDLAYSVIENQWWKKLNDDQRYCSGMVFPTPESAQVKSIVIEESRRIVVLNENDTSSDQSTMLSYNSYASSSPSFNFGKPRKGLFAKKRAINEPNIEVKNIQDATRMSFDKAHLSTNQPNRHSSSRFFKNNKENVNSKHQLSNSFHQELKENMIDAISHKSHTSMSEADGLSYFGSSKRMKEFDTDISEEFNRPRKSIFKPRQNERNRKTMFTDAVSLSNTHGTSYKDISMEHNFSNDSEPMEEMIRPRKTIFKTGNANNENMKKSNFANAVSYDQTINKTDVLQSQKNDDEMSGELEYVPKKSLFKPRQNDKNRKTIFTDAVSLSNTQGTSQKDISMEQNFSNDSEAMEEILRPRRTIFKTGNVDNESMKKSNFANAISYNQTKNKTDLIQMQKNDEEMSGEFSMPKKTLFKSKKGDKKSVFTEAVSLDNSVSSEKSILSNNKALDIPQSQQQVMIADKSHESEIENENRVKKTMFKFKKNENRKPVFANAISYDATKSHDKIEEVLQPQTGTEDDQMLMVEPGNSMQISPFSIGSDSIFYERMKNAASSTFIGGEYINKTPMRSNLKRMSHLQNKNVTENIEEIDDVNEKGDCENIIEQINKKSKLSNVKLLSVNEFNKDFLEEWNETLKRKSESPILKEKSESKTSEVKNKNDDNVSQSRKRLRSSLDKNKSLEESNQVTKKRVDSPILNSSSRITRASVNNSQIKDKSINESSMRKSKRLSNVKNKTLDQVDDVQTKEEQKSKSPILMKTIRTSIGNKSNTKKSKSIIANNESINKSSSNTSTTVIDPKVAEMQISTKKDEHISDVNVNECTNITMDDNEKSYNLVATPETLMRLKSMREEGNDALKLGRTLKTPSPKRNSIRTWMKTSQNDDSSKTLNQSEVDRLFIEEMKAKRTNPPVRRSTIFLANVNDDKNESVSLLEKDLPSYPLRHSNVPVGVHAMIRLNESDDEVRRIDDAKILKEINNQEKIDDNLYDKNVRSKTIEEAELEMEVENHISLRNIDKEKNSSVINNVEPEIIEMEINISKNNNSKIGKDDQNNKSSLRNVSRKSIVEMEEIEENELSNKSTGRKNKSINSSRKDMTKIEINAQNNNRSMRNVSRKSITEIEETEENKLVNTSVGRKNKSVNLNNTKSSVRNVSRNSITEIEENELSNKSIGRKNKSINNSKVEMDTQNKSRSSMRNVSRKSTAEIEQSEENQLANTSIGGKNKSVELNNTSKNNISKIAIEDQNLSRKTIAEIEETEDSQLVNNSIGIKNKTIDPNNTSKNNTSKVGNDDQNNSKLSERNSITEIEDTDGNELINKSIGNKSVNLNNSLKIGLEIQNNTKSSMRNVSRKSITEIEEDQLVNTSVGRKNTSKIEIDQNNIKTSVENISRKSIAEIEEVDENELINKSIEEKSKSINTSRVNTSNVGIDEQNDSKSSMRKVSRKSIAEIEKIEENQLINTSIGRKNKSMKLNDISRNDISKNEMDVQNISKSSLRNVSRKSIVQIEENQTNNVSIKNSNKSANNNKSSIINNRSEIDDQNMSNLSMKNVSKKPMVETVEAKENQLNVSIESGNESMKSKMDDQNRNNLSKKNVSELEEAEEEQTNNILKNKNISNRDISKAEVQDENRMNYSTKNVSITSVMETGENEPNNLCVENRNLSMNDSVKNNISNEEVNKTREKQSIEVLDDVFLDKNVEKEEIVAETEMRDLSAKIVEVSKSVEEQRLNKSKKLDNEMQKEINMDLNKSKVSLKHIGKQDNVIEVENEKHNVTTEIVLNKSVLEEDDVIFEGDVSKHDAEIVNSTRKTHLDMELTLEDDEMTDLELEATSRGVSLAQTTNKQLSVQDNIFSLNNNTTQATNRTHNNHSFSVDSLNRESSGSSFSGIELTTNIRKSRLPSTMISKRSIAYDGINRKTFFFTTEKFEKSHLKKNTVVVNEMDDTMCNEDQNMEWEGTDNVTEDRHEEPSNYSQYDDDHIFDMENDITEPPKLTDDQIKTYMNLMNNAMEDQKKRMEPVIEAMMKPRKDELVTRMNKIDGTSDSVFKKPNPVKPKKKNGVNEGILKNKDMKSAAIVKRKLYMKESWISMHLYNFVQNKLEPKYGIRTRNRSERFIKDLADVVNKVIKTKKDYYIYVKTLKIEMAKLKLVQTHHDFHRFVIDYLPMFFRLKSIPACDRDVPPIKGSLFDPIRE